MEDSPNGARRADRAAVLRAIDDFLDGQGVPFVPRSFPAETAAVIDGVPRKVYAGVDILAADMASPEATLLLYAGGVITMVAPRERQGLAAPLADFITRQTGIADPITPILREPSSIVYTTYQAY